MSEDDKGYYVNSVASICKELSLKTSSAIKGVDGGYLLNTWLDVRDCGDFSPGMPCANCEKMGMDCSSSVFGHDDLAPSNILISSGQARGLGIVDWEMARYVPSAWIRSKLATSWGLDFEWPGVTSGSSPLKEWREGVQQELDTSGF
ncbi:hypothetical protein F4778DRAFT_102461 [Xylariomycetidae sp. FL2044]|nr:hypothetical protein F4778DRAFT_102461 [Xylariomycetidae sp. FL2044]